MARGKITTSRTVTCLDGAGNGRERGGATADGRATPRANVLRLSCAARAYFNIVARHDSAARTFATRKAGKRRASDNKCGFAQRDHNAARAATPRDAASDGQERRGPTAHGRETLHCYRNLGNAISPCLGTRRGHLWTSRRGATKQAASSQAVSRSKTREARDAAWLAARSKCFARQRIATPQATVGRPRTAGQRGAAGGDSGQRFATWSLMQPYLDIAA